MENGIERKGSTMEQDKIKAFIEKYEYLYYEPCSLDEDLRHKYFHKTDVTKEDYIKAKQKVGIYDLKPTDFNVEENIMCLLKNNHYNHIALAWKAGKLLWDDENKELNFGEFDKEEEYFNGYRARIDRKTFIDYCNELKNNKDSIIDLIEKKDWKSAYDKAQINLPKGIGPVNIINAMFFISGGKAPIYDSFVHKATRSLLFGIAPCKIYMGVNPNKEKTDDVILMYCEYMMLLEKLFGGIINNSNMYIPRELDRALWVYGHSDQYFEV